MTRGLTACLALAFFPSLANACPGCQNPNLPVVPSGGVHLESGNVQWGALMSVAPIWVRHDDGCADPNDCDDVPPQPAYVHDQFILPMELRGTLDWGLSEHFGVSMQVPFRVVTTTIAYETPDGDHYDPPNAGTHHRDETLVGIGDPIVAARFATVLGTAWWLVTRIGSSIPLGSTEEDPFAAGDRGDAHQHIQFGTGTFDPFASIALARTFGRWQLSGYGQGQLAMYESDKGFRAGATTLVNARTAFKIAPRWLVQGSLGWFRQGPEEWGGKIQQDGVLGRHEVLAGLGTTFSFGGPQFIALIRVPVWRKILQGPETEEGEITAPVVLTLGIQGRI